MPLGVKIVPDIPGLGGVDGVVSTDITVLAGEPFRPALLVDNASRDDVFAACALRSETLSGGVTRVSVCGTLGGVRGVAGLRDGEEFRERRGG